MTEQEAKKSLLQVIRNMSTYLRSLGVDTSHSRIKNFGPAQDGQGTQVDWDIYSLVATTSPEMRQESLRFASRSVAENLAKKLGVKFTYKPGLPDFTYTMQQGGHVMGNSSHSLTVVITSTRTLLHIKINAQIS